MAERGSPATAVDIRSRVGRVFQHLQYPCTAHRPPDHLLRRRPAQRPHRQLQAGPVQITHHRSGAAKLPKLGKQQQQASLHFFVGVTNHPAVAGIGETRRQGQPQLAPGGLLTLPLMEPNLDLVQLRFAHDPRQAQQQAIVIGARVIHPLAVSNQNAKERTQLDDFDPLLWPAEEDRPVDQPVLQLGALLMLADLPGGRLPHIDVGELRSVRRRHPVFRTRRGVQHDPPRLAPAHPPAAIAAHGRSAVPDGVASPPSSSATPSAPAPAAGPESLLPDPGRSSLGGEPSAIFGLQSSAWMYCANGSSVRTDARGRA